MIEEPMLKKKTINLEEPIIVPKKKKENSNKNKKFNFKFLKKYSVFIILGLVALIGTTYALTFYIEKFNSDEISLKENLLNLNITSNGKVNLNNSVGVIDSIGIKNDKTDFVIENVSDRNVKVTIKLEEDTNNTLSSSNLRYAVFSNLEDLENNILKIGNVLENNNVLYTFEINPQEKVTLYSTLWLDYNYNSSNEVFNGTYVIEYNDDINNASSYIKEKNVTKLSNNEYILKDNNYCLFNGGDLYRILGSINNQLVIIKNNKVQDDTEVNNIYNVILGSNEKDYLDLDTKPFILTKDYKYYENIKEFIDINNDFYMILTLNKDVYIINGLGTKDSPYEFSINN